MAPRSQAYAAGDASLKAGVGGSNGKGFSAKDVYAHVAKHAKADDRTALWQLATTFALWSVCFVLPIWTVPLHALLMIRCAPTPRAAARPILRRIRGPVNPVLRRRCGPPPC